MTTDIYRNDSEYFRLTLRFHTVRSMIEECQRSRSWAYQMIASYPGEKHVLTSLKTGKKELAIPRAFVEKYLMRVRRGNPYW